MRSLRIAAVLTMAALTVGCQSGKFRNPFALATSEPPFTAEELAAVEETVERNMMPVSLTGAQESAVRSTIGGNCTSRRS